MPEDVAAPAVPWPPPAHALPLPAARPAAEGVRVLAGVPYAAIPRIRPLELDVYLPAVAAALVPSVVFLHGGGWQLGSRHSAGPAYAEWSPSPFERLAQAGIAVASVDYRRLCAALQQAGNSVDLETYAGSDHMWRGAPEVPADALDRTVDFLRRMF